MATGGRSIIVIGPCLILMVTLNGPLAQLIEYQPITLWHDSGVLHHCPQAMATTIELKAPHAGVAEQRRLEAEMKSRLGGSRPAPGPEPKVAHRTPADSIERMTSW
jgi:hypothetical protein